MAMHVDAVIAMIAYFGALVIIGIWANRVTAAKKLTSGSQWISEYIVAGRSFGWLVIGFAMVTTIYSAGTFIGAPGLAWNGGYIWPFTVSFQNLAGRRNFDNDPTCRILYDSGRIQSSGLY